MKAIKQVFSTALDLHVELGKAQLSPDPLASHDVSAIIGFSGEYRGSLVLAFPSDVAQRTVSRLIGEDVSTESADFSRAVGELANQVAGSAKIGFEGKKVSISSPSVIMGSSHRVRPSKDMPVVQISADCEFGRFTIEVSLRHEVSEVTGSNLAKPA